MDGSWLFPESNTIHRTGLGEAGIETFKDYPVGSLVREICQNSLDAVKNKDLPVTVEFKNFEIPFCSFPDGKRLLEIFKLCRDFSKEHMENKKTYNFFNKAVELFNKDKIEMLRISDFNTKGLSGSYDIRGTNPWTNLICSDGVSDKGKDSAGSFGIGKNASFACSKFRTVFYSTLDFEGKKAFEGVSKLISFQDKNGKYRDSVGFFGRSQFPIYELLNLDPQFVRCESGSDIYICACDSEYDFEIQVICSVLENFILSVFNRKLDVIVNGKKINKSSLSDILQEYSAESPKKLKITNDYYKVLTSDESMSTKISIGDIGKIDLKVLFNKDFGRRILMTRNNGMKIYDQKNISSSIYFAGIVTTKDENVNQFFKNIENPQHNAWKAARGQENYFRCKRILSKMKQDIKQFIIEKGQGVITDQIDAEGVGEFLPDLSNEPTNIENITDNEGLNYHTGSATIERLEIKNGSIGEFKGDSSEYDVSNMKGDYDESGTMQGYSNGNGHRNGNRPPVKSYIHNPEGRAEIFESKAFSLLSVRMMIMNSKLNIYKLIFSLRDKLNKGYIEISLSGEQGNDKAQIGNAIKIRKNGSGKNSKPFEMLKCRKNRIYLENIPANKKITVQFRLDFFINCSLEAKIYGY